MARSRDDLHDILVSLLESNECYYQPPDDIQITYPCILYELSSEDVDYANNHRYRFMKNYTINVIDDDPDSLIQGRIAGLEYCRFVRSYSEDNIHHFVFELYF